MAQIYDEIFSPAGTWLTIEEEPTERLNVCIHPFDTLTVTEPGLTIFWRGRAEAGEFIDFFDAVMPSAQDFRPWESRRNDMIIDFAEGEFSQEGFSGPAGYQPRKPEWAIDRASFIRIDHRRVTAVLDEPVLVVWANLEAARGDDIPQDAAGVLIQSRHLSGLQAKLAEFISKTSADQPSPASVGSSLALLDLYLRPDVQPLAARA